MTPITTFAGRRVALFGLGGSGLAMARALVAGGAEVVCCDDNAASLDTARAEGLATADLRSADWSGFAALVLAPGVPLTHPAPHWTVDHAWKAGVEIIGDIELFCRERAVLAPDAPFVAITGTNGKSTTTALVAHVLRALGREVAMGGNIGTAILSLPPPSRSRVHVVEMSSFQIDLTPSLGGLAHRPPHAEVAGRAGPRSTGDGASFEEGGSFGSVSPDGPTVGVLMNITPDHLDRHGTLELYAAIKARLVARAGTAVVGIDDRPSRAIYDRLASAHRRVQAVTGFMLPGDGYYFEGSRIFASQDRDTRLVADLEGIGSLRGAHNAQNAAVALAVADALGLDEEDAVAALAGFPGLHHRMEEVGRLGAAIFVNDSKATNADSAEKALRSFERIFWILGGKPKEGGIAPLRPLFDRVEKAYLIGAATEDFAAALDGVPHARCGTLDRAVAEAAADAGRSATKDPVILLSPACASYDQYPNFEVRGDHFRQLVGALPGVEMRS